VANLTDKAEDEQTSWQVNVTDAGSAESQILRLVLADESLTVTDFGRKTQNLEEVFLEMVEGSNSNGH